MMLTRLKLIITVVLCIAILGIPTASAQPATPGSTPAAEEENLSYPEFYIAAVGDFPEGYFRDVTVGAGETVELQLEVGNIGDIPASIRVVKVNANVANNGGFTPGEEGEAPTGATSWIQLDPVVYETEPNTAVTHSFKVTVPEGTPPGQYMAGLMALTAEPVPIPGTELFNQTIRTAITIAIVVPGEIQTSFELGEPQVSVDINGMRKVQVSVENTGNYLVRPQGELVLSNESGTAVNAPIEMGSVYTGNSTNIVVNLPGQMSGGSFDVNLALQDPESDASASIENFSITVPNVPDADGVSVMEAIVEPNAEEVVFANVDITLNNGGPQIPATDVNLEVLRDGEGVDTFPLASNQVMLEGENSYTTRYIPADMWEPGTYTFRITVSAVSPDGAERTELLNEDLFVEIVVP